MRALLLAVGARMPDWIAAGFNDYARRLARELPLHLIEVVARSRDPARAQAEEGEALLAAVPKGTHVVALDGRGDAWSSTQLANQLERWRGSGKDLALLVGGADGHAKAVLERARQCWSLGPLTLPHMLVRVIVAEQLYRASSLLAKHPYHRA